MKKPTPQASVITTGLAMFSMFFGAGNVVFPLALGQAAETQNHFAVIGFLITAVGVPFMGLIAMTLFDGNYKRFFDRLGHWPGLIIAFIIMGLIGPFGALPRCIALSHASISNIFPSLSLPVFSIISCLIIFLFTYKPNNIIEILGKALTPFLLGALAIIIIKGLVMAPPAPETDKHSLAVLVEGIKSGYQTMDLLGAFFFCGVVLACLKSGSEPKNPEEHVNYKRIIILTLKASCIGAILLGAIYVGFSYVASSYSLQIKGIPTELLLGTLSHEILGKYGAFVTAIAVALACLTTAIALAAVFAEYLHLELSKQRLNYTPSLIITLIISFFISTLNFTGIISFLAPILEVCYPALITLTLVNIGYKMIHFKPVKTPVYAVFFFTLLYTLLF